MEKGRFRVSRKARFVLFPVQSLAVLRITTPNSSIFLRSQHLRLSNSVITSISSKITRTGHVRAQCEIFFFSGKQKEYAFVCTITAHTGYLFFDQRAQQPGLSIQIHIWNFFSRDGTVTGSVGKVTFVILEISAESKSIIALLNVSYN